MNEVTAQCRRESYRLRTRILHTLVHVLKLSTPSHTSWRPSLLGWSPSLLGWRPSLVGWRPSLRKCQESKTYIRKTTAESPDAAKDLSRSAWRDPLPASQRHPDTLEKSGNITRLQQDLETRPISHRIGHFEELACSRLFPFLHGKNAIGIQPKSNLIGCF